MASIAIHGFDYNSGCRKESPSYGLRFFWAVESGLFEENLPVGGRHARFNLGKEGKQNAGLATNQLVCSKNPIAQPSTSTKGDLQIICWDTPTFAPMASSTGSKGTSPGALGQDNCLRKSTTRHPRTFVTNDSYIVQPILYSFLSIYLDRAEQEVAI